MSVYGRGISIKKREVDSTDVATPKVFTVRLVCELSLWPILNISYCVRI